MILKQQQENFSKLNSSLNFIWIRSNQREYLMKKILTAYEFSKTSFTFWWTNSLSHKRLSSLHSSQQLIKHHFYIHQHQI
jgi:hypothetical protein